MSFRVRRRALAIAGAFVLVGIAVLVTARSRTSGRDAGDQTDIDPEVENRPAARFGRPLPQVPADAPTAGPVGSPDLVACVEGRSCRRGTACIRGDQGRVACVPSECEPRRSPCPSGMSCRLVSLAEKVFRCVPGGAVDVEGTCSDSFPAPMEARCKGELACWHGRCRTACAKDRDCAPREKCTLKSPLERVCASDTCDSDGDCPANRPLCLDLRDSSPSSCFAKAEGSCRPGACPQDQVCDAQIEGDRMNGRCRPGCDLAKGTGCPPDSVCSQPKGIVSERARSAGGICYRACSPASPHVCAQGEVCMTLGMGTEKWGCVSAPARYQTIGQR